jgi:hypothetical protein
MNDEQKKKDEFAERWIDSALDRYTDAEPRLGFETRLLASIAVERERRPRWHAMWMWAASGAAVAVLTALIVLSVSHRQNTVSRQNTAKSDPPSGASGQPTTGERGGATVLPKSQAPQTSDDAGAQQVATYRPPRRPTVRPTNQPSLTVASTQPRQAQFPTPAPLSEQERLLLAYVRATPKEEIENVIAEKQAFQKHVDSLGVPEEQEKSDR